MMLIWVSKIVVISLVLIILVHYLYSFFKTTLTVPKVKDLVYRPSEKYEKLFDTIKLSNTQPHKYETSHLGNQPTVFGMPNEAGITISDLTGVSSSSTPISALQPVNSNIEVLNGHSPANVSTNSMKQELKQYLKGLNASDSTPIFNIPMNTGESFRPSYLNNN
jgi:hypothetical protein